MSPAGWSEADREHLADLLYGANGLGWTIARYNIGGGNSPRWFMTASGRVSGAQDGHDDNLRPGQEPAFAAYLARVVEELQRRHGIVFRPISPMNEPSTAYWFAANTQGQA